ncbi:MAG: glycosyltransferase family 2 protein [Rhodospirillales bacterium]|nr:glycosyltransferase family 2 protein [Rhodospirillales bacterium]
MITEPLSLSVVSPCFSEEQVLPEFLRRTRAVCDSLDLPYEIVIVDDGSGDRTWSIISEAAAADPRILGMRLRRNHGHQLALSAGIAATKGAMVLLIDSDLQDPPELLPAMIERLCVEGADVVYGQRRRRAGDSLFKRATAAAFYRLIDLLSDVPIPRDTGDFRLISREVADLLCRMPERHRFVRGMIAWVGGRQVPFPYDRCPRGAGSTKYPLRRMVRFAVDAITGFSRRPLQAATLFGIAAVFFSIALALYSLLGWVSGVAVPGWTSLMSAVGFLSALQFLMLGMLGEYLGRLYEESQGRPLFLEAGRVGSGLAIGERTRVRSERELPHAAIRD